MPYPKLQSWVCGFHSNLLSSSRLKYGYIGLAALAFRDQFSSDPQTHMKIPAKISSEPWSNTVAKPGQNPGSDGHGLLCAFAWSAWPKRQGAVRTFGFCFASNVGVTVVVFANCSCHLSIWESAVFATRSVVRTCFWQTCVFRASPNSCTQNATTKVVWQVVLFNHVRFWAFGLDNTQGWGWASSYLLDNLTNIIRLFVVSLSYDKFTKRFSVFVCHESEHFRSASQFNRKVL